MNILIFNFMLLTFAFSHLTAVNGITNKLFKIIKHEVNILTTGGDILPEDECEGVLELKDVSFSYPARKDSLVLNKISLKVDNNSKKVIALCGASGCGKSTIISMV